MLDSVALIDDSHGRPGVLPYMEAILEEKASGASTDLSGCTLVTHSRRDLAALAGTLPVEFYGHEG